MDVTLERNPGRHREEGSGRLPTKRSRSLGSGGPRVQALRWARGVPQGEASRPGPASWPEARLRAASPLGQRNFGIVWLLARLGPRELYRRSAATRASARQPPLGGRPGRQRPISAPGPAPDLVPSTVSKNRLKRGEFAWVSQQEPVRFVPGRSNPVEPLPTRASSPRRTFRASPAWEGAGRRCWRRRDGR